MTDFAAFRALFPALQDRVWLNSATLPPAATPVLEALRRVEGEWERGDGSWQAWEEEAHATREQFARLIGGEATGVALLPTVAEAAATVAASLPRGRVVVGEREFQSNLFPWLALRDRGFEVAEVPATDGVVPTDALVEALTDGTVLVAVSEVQSSNGFRVRIAKVAERAREVGARLFVNGTQALGVLRFDQQDIAADYVACHGYKWLLAPRGTSWLHVREDRIDELAPLAPNWKSVERPYEEYYGGPLRMPPEARKLDISLAWFPWVGARAALDLILSLDPAAVEARCLGLAAELREGVRERGFRTVPEEEPSQIVALEVPDPATVRQGLLDRRVVCAVRGGFVRLGFHAFNDESDVAAALDALGRG